MSNLQSTTSPILPEHEDDPDTFHIFVMVKTTRHWLDMKTEHRRAFLDQEIIPLLRRRPELKIRWFEPEAFSIRATDVMICETRDLSAWAWLCDHLRDSLFWDHYFEVLDIMPALEGSYLR
ncbi:darcynin family protein [Bradyrhizobium erythrophlei]|uniref:darcynin family protein n=1 Tax=Bradyrhizobium erythrophlei TaxID=1437360 RepID=UPI0035EA8CB8